MNNEKQQENEKLPPILGSWKKLYLLVIGNLFVLILLFYLLTRSYS